MRTLVIIIAFAVYALGTTLVYAEGGCSSACADGYTYSQESKSCVKKVVSS